MCTIVLPWGKYEYQKLPMGLCNSPDIFQEKMSTLFHDFENVRAYIDDLLVLGTGTWDEHLQQIEEPRDCSLLCTTINIVCIHSNCDQRVYLSNMFMFR